MTLTSWTLLKGSETRPDALQQRKARARGAVALLSKVGPFAAYTALVVVHRAGKGMAGIGMG